MKFFFKCFKYYLPVIAVALFMVTLSFTVFSGTNAVTHGTDTIPYNTYMTAYGYKTDRMWTPDGLVIPVGDTTFGTDKPRAGGLKLKSSDNKAYVYTTQNKWVGIGSGSVTSVALDPPAWLSVSGSPVTGDGTITLSGKTGQTANEVLATPDGAAGPVSLRALTSGDIPGLATTKITSGIFATARLGTGTASSSTYLRGDGWHTLPTTSTPNLQQVTDVDSLTTNSIKIINGTDSVLLRQNGNIYVSGTITAEKGGFNSDRRLKKDISPTVPSIIDVLQTVRYKWKDAKKGRAWNYGYIAQDVDRFLPTAVMKDGNGMLSLNYSEIHTLAIHDLIVKVQDQAHQISELQDVVNKLIGQDYLMKWAQQYADGKITARQFKTMIHARAELLKAKKL